MEKFQRAKKRGKYEEAVGLVQRSLPHLPALASEFLTPGKNDLEVARIPVLDEGAVIMAAMGRQDVLQECRRMASVTPGMARWVAALTAALAEAEQCEDILRAVHASPGITARELKTSSGISDGRALGRLVQWLEKVGRVRKEKAGSSWSLWPAGTQK